MGLLGWALVFLIVAVIAAILGFGGMATATVGAARLLFILALAVFLALIIAGLVGVSLPTA